MSESPKKPSGAKRKIFRFLLILFVVALLAVGVLAILHFTNTVKLPFLSSNSEFSAGGSDNRNGGSTDKPAPGNSPPAEADNPNIKGPRSISFLNKKAVPPANGIMWGAYVYGDKINWGTTVAEYNSRIGYNMANIGIFVTTEGASERVDEAILMDAARNAQRTGAVLTVSWEPFGGLNTVTDAYVNNMVRLLKDINAMGVPVILRWCHEMNGGWYIWGQKPALYKSTWIRMARAVKENCPLTSLMWAPNSSNGTPFIGPQSPRAGSAEYNQLDTNGDGRWDINDDPFAPYYPGDEYVDWVGLSLFYYGTSFPFNENLIVPQNYMTEILTGTASNTPAVSFYDEYAIKRNKFLAVAETSAPFYIGSGVTGLSDPLRGKRTWWNQLLGDETRSRFPALKLVNWFEFKKDEDRSSRDFAITNSTTIVNAFKEDISKWPVVFAKGG